MHILFDKNVPNQIRRVLADHWIETAAKLGWDDLSNGALLSAAETAGFEVMITADQNLQYQQNLGRRTISIVVLGSNRGSLVKEHLSEIAEAVSAAKTNSFVFIKMPLPPKRAYNAR